MREKEELAMALRYNLICATGRMELPFAENLFEIINRLEYWIYCKFLKLT